MRRRDFIIVSGAATAWPLAARTQQAAVPIVAVLSGSSALHSTFTKGMAETGFDDGRNVSVEFHSVSGRYDRLPEMARELVSRRVAVISPWGIDAAQAAKEATSSIPIVFVFGVDPIKFGFVGSISRS